MNYEDFLKSKRIVSQATGIGELPVLNTVLFPFQSDVTAWALRRGRAALFEDAGLGKTIQELEWSKHVAAHTKGRVLILAPLAVSIQHASEAEKFGYDVTLCSLPSDVRDGINITNYEKLHKFDAEEFNGAALDESSILKNYAGAFRNEIIERFASTQFRLAGTATPAPNDYMELGNHAEFLGVMSRAEMLATFFVHDGGDTAQWRIKGHAQQAFWKWICSWAVSLRKPSDLGHDNGGYDLPPLITKEIAVESNQKLNGYLFPMPASSLVERRDARRDSTGERVCAAADLINKSTEQWIAWCDLNVESNLLHKAIPGSIEITGSDSDLWKLEAAKDFLSGKKRVLVSKPSIFGHGMNMQNCRNVVFVGLSDSWEMYYQAVRRCWRFGQTKAVNVFIITSRNEGAVLANIKRKEKDAIRMSSEMLAHMTAIQQKEIKGSVREVEEYKPSQQMELPSWIK